ncbi:MAG: FHA domain-containing protein [Candidatus Asgardarchaeum sp.]
MVGWKERLKKISKRVLPIVVSIAAGTVFPPAAGAISTLLRERLSKFDLSFDDNILSSVSESILTKMDQVDEIFENFKKQLMEKNKELSHLVSSAVEYSLRDIYNQITATMQQINELKEKQASLLEDLFKEMKGLGVPAQLPQIQIGDILNTFTVARGDLLTSISSLERITTQLDQKLGEMTSAGVLSLDAFQNDFKQYLTTFNENIEIFEKKMVAVLSNGGLLSPEEMESINLKLNEFKSTLNELQNQIFAKEGAKTLDLDVIRDTLTKNANEFKNFVSEFEKKFPTLLSEKLSLPSNLSSLFDVGLKLTDKTDQISKFLADLEKDLPELIEKGKLGEVSKSLLSKVDEFEAIVSDVEARLIKVLEEQGIDVSKVSGDLKKQLAEYKDYVMEIKRKIESGELDSSELVNITNSLKQKADDLKVSISNLNVNLPAFAGIGAATVATGTVAGGGAMVSPTTMITIATKIPGLLGRLRRSKNRLDEKFLESYSALSKKLDAKSIRMMSVVQMQMAQTSSRYDINYDPDLYVERYEEKDFDEFIREMQNPEALSLSNVFLVLADAGIGKTWFLAHLANKLVDQEFPVFFISLRLGFKSQLETIFNTDYFRVDSVISQMNDIVKKPVVLFLDGLDEVPSSERSAILRYIISLGGRRDIAIVLSCRTIDWISDPAITDNLPSMNRIIYSTTEYHEVKASAMLSEFTDEQLKDACEKYGIPVPTGELFRLAKKPYILRLLSEFYTKNGRFIDINNINEVLAFIADPHGASIFNRVGIRGFSRDLLLKLIDKFVESESKEIPLEEISDMIMGDKEAWARIISSGLIKQEERMFGTFIILDEFYGKYLILLALNRKKPSERPTYASKAVLLFPELKQVIPVSVAQAPSQAMPALQTVTFPVVKAVGVVAKARLSIGNKSIDLDIPVGETRIYRSSSTGMLEANLNGMTKNLGLTDPTVSRRHLLIKFDGQQLIVIDEGSSNGTFINGQRIPRNTPYKISEGQSIRIGFGTTIQILGFAR